MSDWSGAMAVTSTGDKRKETKVVMAATKMKGNIRSGFIWPPVRPATFNIVINFERNYKVNTTWVTIYLISTLNLLKPTGYVMHHQFNIQQLYVLPTLYLCVLYLSENKQRLVPLTA